jgi:Periplasmic binding protein
MRGMRGLTTVIVVALGVSGLVAGAGAGAGAQSSTSQLEATDIGITAKEIHLALLADVDTPLAPGLFQSSVDAVRGLAKYLNANGGLAGRKVVVDFYDSKLNPNTSRNGEIQACQNDVAMVGTAALLLASVDEMRNCKDATGAVTGIPDIPFVTNVVVHGCSDESFPIVPPTLVCSTKDQHPQTYQAGVGRGRYFQAKYGKQLHGVYIFPSNSVSGRNGFFAGLGALRDIGISSDGDFDRLATATQSQFTEVVAAMKNKHSNYALCTLTWACTVSLRREATLQGLTGVKVWDCSVQCYDRQFLTTGGADVEGEYVSIPFLPFDNGADQKTVKMLANFVKYTGASRVTAYGAYAWAAGIALRDAVNAAVKAHGINGVTRKTIFEALNKIHNFNADGFFAPIDLAGRRITTCTVINQVRHGRFVRVVPTKPGTFSCPGKSALDLHQLDFPTG